MDPINGINRIVENLRRQIAKKEKSQHTSSTSAKSQSTKSATTHTRLSSIQLQAKISERISGIDKKTNNFNQEATKIILESILLWEFGDNIINDPEFSDMVDDLTTTITGSNENNKMIELIQNLSSLSN